MSRNAADDKDKPNHLARAKKRIFQAGKPAGRHPVFTGNMFISQAFEFRFILKFCVFAVLGGLLFTGLILFYCSGSLTTTFDGSRLVIKQTSLTVLPGVLYTNLIMLILAVMVSIIMTFYFSRSFLKPLFRFREDIKAIANGDLTQTIQYRSGDMTTSLSQNINLMTLNLNSKICEIETGLKQTIDAAQKSIPDELVMELIQLQRSIKENFIL